MTIRAGSATPATASATPLPAEQLARHAVALLAVEHTRAERMLASRWVNVADALTYGATLDRVAGTRGRGLRVIGTRRAIGEL